MPQRVTTTHVKGLGSQETSPQHMQMGFPHHRWAVPPVPTNGSGRFQKPAIGNHSATLPMQGTGTLPHSTVLNGGLGSASRMS